MTDTEAWTILRSLPETNKKMKAANERLRIKLEIFRAKLHLETERGVSALLKESK